MTISPLAKRYAQALYELGSERRTIDTIVSDMAVLAKLIGDLPHFSRFLRNPSLSAQVRINVLRASFEHQVSADTFRFMSFLNQKNRLGLLDEICLAVLNLHSEKQDVLKVKVQSSFALPAADVKAIVERLEKRFQKTIEAETAVDAALIGGLKIQVGDDVFDYSLKTQLEKFKEHALRA